MITQRRRYAFLAVMLALSIAGCSSFSNMPAENAPADSAPANAAPEKGGQAEAAQTAELKSADPDLIYEITLPGGKIWYFDEKGETVPEEKRFTILRDVISGEPRCKVRRRTDDTGIRDEWGNPTVKRMSALYDLDGNLIRDFEEIGYEEGFGDYVIRHDARPLMAYAEDLPEDYHTALWNFKTQEEHAEGVDRAEKLGENILLKDIWSSPVGVMSASGEKLAGFPVQKTYYSAQATNSGRIVASERSPFGSYDEAFPDEALKKKKDYDVLLTSDFEEICSYKYINGIYYRLYGDFLLFRNDDDIEGIITPDNELVYSAPENARIEYFDGGLVILSRKDPYEEANPWKYSLETLDGTVLAEDFNAINPVEPAEYSRDKKPAERFFGIKENQIVIMNRKGETLAATSEKANYDGMEALYGGLYSASARDGEETRCALLDTNLNIVVPFGKYRWFTDANSYSSSEKLPEEILKNRIFAYDNNYGNYGRIDVIDSTGKPVIENLSERYYQTGVNGFAAKKGFDVGLMDWNGNWIVKRSIFSDLTDE